MNQSKPVFKTVFIDKHKSIKELNRDLVVMKKEMMHQALIKDGFDLPKCQSAGIPVLEVVGLNELKSHNLISLGFAVGAIMGLSSGYFLALLFNGLVA